MMQMTSRLTRAMATTSVRRITGGNSLVLLGTGTPSRSWAGWRSPVVVGGDLVTKGLVAEGLAGDGLVGEGLVGVTLTMVFPRPKRR